MLSKKLVMYPLLITLAVAPLIGGCTVQRKPTPTPAPVPRSTTPAPTTMPGPMATPIPTPTRTTTPKAGAIAPTDTNREAQRMATLISKIRDVRSASVVLSGKTAHVGLDVGKATGARTSAIKKEAAKIVRREDPRITTAYVATDNPTVAKIRRVSEGVAKGTPLTSFKNDLAQITRKILPTRP
ncbi:MAG: YhcN/YlaJ family sporulation lipoprotein [Carboxydocellales bacterium]